MMEVHDHAEEARPYMDETSRSDPSLRGEFVQDLFGRGLVSFTRRVRCMNALFS